MNKAREQAKAESDVKLKVATPEDFKADNMLGIIGPAMLRQHGYYCFKQGSKKYYVEVAK